MGEAVLMCEPVVLLEGAVLFNELSWVVGGILVVDKVLVVGDWVTVVVVLGVTMVVLFIVYVSLVVCDWVTVDVVLGVTMVVVLVEGEAVLEAVVVVLLVVLVPCVVLDDGITLGVVVELIVVVGLGVDAVDTVDELDCCQSQAPDVSTTSSTAISPYGSEEEVPPFSATME